MTLLIQALREVRTLHGDFELLPSMGQSESLAVGHVPRGLEQMDHSQPRDTQTDFGLPRTSGDPALAVTGRRRLNLDHPLPRSNEPPNG